MSTLNIDYNALAAALLLAVPGANATTGTHSGKHELLAKFTNLAGSEVVGPNPGTNAEDCSHVVADWAEDSVSGGSGEGVDGLKLEDTGSEGSVEFAVAKPCVSSCVQNVKFGGLGDAFPQTTVQREVKQGYYATVVRGERARRLKAIVERLSGVKFPKRGLDDLAVCTYAAGTMPDVVKDGKVRLRSLAAIGDAVLTMMLVTHQYALGRSVESAQSARTRLTNNNHLCSVMRMSGMVDCVSYPTGVDPSTSVATATAFEAVLGVLSLYRSTDSVRQFLVQLQLLG